MRANVRVQAGGNSDVLARILRSETEEDISRGEVSVKATGTELEIDIRTEDIVSLRAALNSYLRWTKLAMETKEVIGVIE